MSEHRRVVFVKLGLIVAVVSVGFLFLQGPTRHLEARAAVALLALLGANGAGPVLGSSIWVGPAHHAPFLAVVTPACSSIASALAVLCLGAIAPCRSRTRKCSAIGVAIAVVVAGNVVRIAASVAVGLVAGRSSLVLFHDWVGGLFTFLYIFGGYMLLISVLLPGARRQLVPSRAHVG